jgi:hypothetical protein
MDGNETISHNASKLKFPPQVYPILPEGYVVEYDGVAVPEVSNYQIASKSDFKSLQLYVAAGFRSDWDINNHWRLSFDFRLNYGLYDPRTDEYVAKVNAYQQLYDLPGERRDLFPQLSFGISRYIDFEKSDKERAKKLKGSPKGYRPVKYPYPKPRNSKPKG